MFDVLTYEKGAAVVRMLEQYLGEEAFREGIRRYMKAHRYANTETTDLWDAIEEATGEPVRRIMDSRSEEHTSELQSLMRISYAVFCLKKKKKHKAQHKLTNTET